MDLITILIGIATLYVLWQHVAVSSRLDAIDEQRRQLEADVAALRIFVGGQPATA